MKCPRSGVWTLAAGVMSGLVAAMPSASGNEVLAVLHRYELGGEGGWDYLTFDASSRRVFITRGEHVMVVDADSGKLLGDITGVRHAHGVALVPGMKRGYVSNGHGDSVTSFDSDSLKVGAEFPVTGKDPDAILFDDASDHVFAFNGHSNNVSAIDPVSGKVVATIAVPGRPEFAVSDGHGLLYVNLEDTAHIARVDSRKATVTATWPLGSCKGPTGLALDILHQRLFSVCDNRQLVVLDAVDGKLVATVPIGDGPDAVVYDPQTATVYSSNGDGTLTVIHQDDKDHYRVVASVTTPVRSKTMTLDPKTHHLFLGAARFGATPAPTKAEPEPKPAMLPGSFSLIEVGAP